jgi:uncharacterized protein (DUF58 family)
MRTGELLSPGAAARVRELELFARTRVEGFLKGPNRSRFKGISAEFLQHRAYVPGDDPRRLDWRVLARTDRLVTREFEEFTNADVVLALDFSGSMGWTHEPMAKGDFMLHCAAMLAWLCNSQNDRFAVAACGPALTAWLPPGSGKKHLASAFHLLVNQPFQGEARLSHCVALLLRQLSRRSIVILLSDCYEEPEPLCAALGQLVARGHDVIVYQTVHPNEQDLEFSGFTLFRDLETGRTDGADPAEIRAAYRDVVREHRLALHNGTARHGIEFRELPVTADWDAALAALLHARRA